MARTLGRYELVAPIGRGGMAEVFLARRRGPAQVEKRLVIKRIRRERIGDPRFIEMFVEEARLSMALAHKNIVPMFDFGRAGDELFLVMEYVDGVDLGAVLSWLRERGAMLAPMLAAYIGLEACQALDYAHRLPGHAGIVHRDITPGNVLVSVMGEVKLVDFGVAAAVSDMASDSRVRGTPAYMAPEQARGDAVDGRADVFALGLVLWEALAGCRAYAGRNPGDLLAVAKAGVVPALPSAVPGALRAIIAKATAAELAERYADARAMQLALDEFLVAARASVGGAPPSHELATLVAEVQAGRRPDVEEIRPPTAPAVTYADDGEDKLYSALFDEGGATTMRSMAATVAETMVEAESSEGQDTSGHEAGGRHAAGENRGGEDRGGKGRAGETALDIGAGSVQQGEAADLSAGRASEIEQAAQGNTGTRRPVQAIWAALFFAGMAAVILWMRAREPGPLQGATSEAPDDVQPAAMPEAAEAVTAGAANPLDSRDIPDHALPARAPASTGAVPEQAPIRESLPVARPAMTERDGRPRVAAQRKLDKDDTRSGKPADAQADQVVLGTVKVSATPWAQVSVDRHSASCPETPCVLRLPAGSYTLRLVNPVAKLRKELAVTVHGDKPVVVSTDLTAAE